MQHIQSAIAHIVGSLDSLPDPVRALLAALVLAGVVGLISKRIARSGAGFNLAFRKTAIVALVGIPLVICFALNWRFVVMVEELPAIGGLPGPIWWIAYAIWGGGALWWLGKLGMRLRQVLHYEAKDIPDKIRRRIEIWSDRLDLDPRKIRIVLDGEDRPRVAGWSRPVLSLPRAAERWRVGHLDAVVLHELLHVKQKTWRWLVLGEVISAIYWPTPWLRDVLRDVNEHAQRVADAKASALLHDSMGYGAALKDMAERIGNDVSRFPIDPAVIQWGDGESIRQRREIAASSYGGSDPLYDKVFWALAQATLAVFLLTGTTLREAREDEESSCIVLNPFNVGFERSEKYMDKDVETKR